MRVYELAKELGTGSAEVLAVAGKLGIAATAPASGVTDEEVARIRERLKGDSPGGDASGGEMPAAAGVVAPVVAGSLPSQGQARYRLVRKGSVTAGSVRVVKGGFVDEAVYAALPDRVKGWFDAV